MAPFFEFSRLPIDKRWWVGFWHPEARSHRRSKTFVARSFVRPSCYRRRRSFNVKPSFCANLKPTIICHTQCQPEGNSMTVGIEKCPINSNLIQMLPKNFKSVLVKIENIRRSICNRPSSNNMIQALTLVMVIASRLAIEKSQRKLIQQHFSKESDCGLHILLGHEENVGCTRGWSMSRGNHKSGSEAWAMARYSINHWHWQILD